MSIGGVLTPMMLTAGTFFLLSGLPEWAQVLGNVNPLHHCAALVFLAVVTWRIAVWAMTRKLVT